MDLKELWQSALNDIEINISRASFMTWFKNSSLIKKEGGTAIVSCHNNFTKEWLENKYNKLILKALRSVDTEIKTIEYTIKADNAPKPPPKTPSNRVYISSESIPLELGGYVVDKDTNLNPRYGFENFIVGASNEVAHAASLAISQDPGTKYNPLFIYGGVGLGKTHLLHAIGNAIKERFNQKKKIKYITAEKFLNDLITSIRTKTIDELKHKFRSLDVLLIDDIQFISKSEKTQEELFHIFNSLYEKNRQIIFSSDRPPKAIASIEERLRSRFEGGMIADITLPDLETRMAILKAKAQRENVVLNEKTIETIARNIQKNIRELEGAFNRVTAYIKVKGKEPLEKEIEALLSDISRPNNKILTPKQVIKAVIDFYDLTEESLLRKSRSQELVKPRQVAMYLMREVLKMSYPNIGEKLGGKDHTTVIHACEKIEKELVFDTQLSQEINSIKEKVFVE
ncbi:MAG: chromosomal replication initiation protein, chromosomal replication initiator protein [Parcubacteria group bacterium GW2011_GWC1_45_9]|nr:MAG: Chromosomal replication initiator protein DnaA [Parcubacteria group bacterium GW2011_GWA1_Parcubacteria_45_10]KKT88721.1 MAG: Chromosomal replication initiator protein DnaA [Parcubacteria group bacterium GW2011_GWB1_45_10]KKU17467.1 MAG: chromosomal replication initiation protein, chromosomal replication initiator protein [Parcubacteria group bacterium GW2011_GWC1_45_9]